MLILKGITTNVSKYRDNDGIINLLTEDGYFSILGRGMFKNNSPLSVYRNSFIYGSFECYKGNTKGLKLRNCKVISYFYEYFKNYDELLILNTVKEFLLKTNNNTDFYYEYNSLIKMFDKIKENINELYDQVILFFYKYIKEEGIFDMYSIFKNKNEVLFKEIKEYLNSISNDTKIEIKDDLKKDILLSLLEYISMYFSINFNSLSLFK